MTSNLKLRKLSKKDLNRIMELFPDEEILKNIGLDIPIKKVTREFEKKWLIGKIKEYGKKRPKEYQLAIEIDGLFAGVIGLNKINFENEQGEVGYWLGRSYWGKGFMTRALKEFIKQVDKKFNLVRIEGKVFTYNPSSSKVLKNCKFKYEGTNKKAKKIKNKFIDHHLYARIK